MTGSGDNGDAKVGKTLNQEGFQVTLTEEDLARLGRVPGMRQLSKGDVVGKRFVIEELLGQGGTGAVYSALDNYTRQTIALKLIRHDRVPTPEKREKLFMEAAVARGIRHKNVVAVYDAGLTDANEPYITMEKVEGRLLRSWMQEQVANPENCPLDVAAAIIFGILEGLGAAHDLKIIHRDLKPENVFLIGEPKPEVASVKILDFGLAAVANATDRTSSSLGVGTAYYMAPEQETAPNSVTVAADFYALSVIFYELLVGARPVSQLDRVRQQRSDIPVAIDELIYLGLSKNWRLRPNAVAKYKALLHAALRDDAPAKAEPPKSDTPRTDTPRPPAQTNEEMALAARTQAFALFDGGKVRTDPVKARQLFETAAKLGDTTSMCNLGWMIEHGEGGPKDLAAAREWYRKAAEGGLAMGMFNYANYVLNGTAGPKDRKIAHDWYAKAAALGDADAKKKLQELEAPLTALGAIPVRIQADALYKEGKASASETAEAVKLYVEAAEAGDVDAMNALGRMARWGEGVQRNSDNAKVWFRKAAELGDPYAMYMLGWMLKNGEANDGWKYDTEGAIRWLTKASEAGEMRAAAMLGDMLSGEQQLKLYQKSAEGGWTAAMTKLGKLLLSGGTGVAVDRAAARQWLEKASAKGDTEATRLLKEKF